MQWFPDLLTLSSPSHGIPVTSPSKASPKTQLGQCRFPSRSVGSQFMTFQRNLSCCKPELEDIIVPPVAEASAFSVL